MDLNPLQIVPVEGPVPVSFAEDFRVDVAFRDSQTGEVFLDRTGENAVLVSELLQSLPAEALAQFVAETAPRMVAIAGGLA